MSPQEAEPLVLQRIGPVQGAPPLPLPPPWAEKARVELNEDPAQAARNVAALRRKVLEEGEKKGLYARTDDTFLLSFLRARKHNVDHAFKTLKEYYRMTKQHPTYTEDSIPSEKPFIFDQNGFSFLQEKDKDGHVIVVLRFENVDLNVVETKHFFQQLWTSMRLALEDPLVQVCGVQVLLDFTGFALRHATIITPSFARVTLKFLQDCFPVRVQGIHVVFEPFYFDAIYMLFRPFLKAKLKDRVHMYGSRLDMLHEHLGAHCLPPHLGGCAQGWNTEEYRQGIQRNEPLLKDWRKYGYGKSPDTSPATPRSPVPETT